jgi:hypothetical protein
VTRLEITVTGADDEDAESLLQRLVAAVGQAGTGPSVTCRASHCNTKGHAEMTVRRGESFDAPAVPAKDGRDCDTCGHAGTPSRGNPCRDCMPPDWPHWAPDGGKS